MNFSETMEQHMNKLSVMAEELKAIQAKVPLEVKVMVFLLSLSNSYKFLVTSLESYKSMKLAWEDVTTKFLNKEFMKRERSDAPNTSDVTLVQKSQNNIDSKNITRN
jgi:hypothetical protein